MSDGNVKFEVTDNKLYIEIDLSTDLGLSKAGKSQLIASTKGNREIPVPGMPSVKLGVNCYRPV